MAGLTVTIPYKPRPLQRLLHAELEKSRWNAIVCHRRFGKTVMEVNRLIKAALSCPKPDPRYAYLAPTYAQGKAIAWDYLKKYSAGIPAARVNESELRIDYPNKARIRIFGCDNPDSLRGLYLDGAVLDEYALMRPSVFTEIIRPALADREGFADFIGTPKGKNQFWELYEYGKNNGWFTALYKASGTDIVDEKELKAMREIMSVDEYAQEFECSFEASIQGAYYANQFRAIDEEARICNVPHEPTVKVDTWWDLGIGDATAIWFSQTVGKEVRLIDYYEASGEGLPHYAKVLQQRGYVYGTHNAPHDIEVRELSTGKSRKEAAKKLSIDFQVVPNLSLEDGIEATRSFLAKCWFDRTRCKDGVNALRSYHKEYDEKRKIYKDRPNHDWSSHPSDAFRYLAVGWTETRKKTDYRPPMYGTEGAWMGA